jgi:hypothetical protein
MDAVETHIPHAVVRAVKAAQLRLARSLWRCSGKLNATAIRLFVAGKR